MARRFAYLADWTDRIAKGELPHTKPLRPQGVERNIVVTTWDWLDEKHYLHDLIASDRRNPTVNAYGPLYGSAEYSTDMIPVLDPVKNSAGHIVAPIRDANTPEALGPGMQRAKNPCNRRLTGARKRSGTPRPTITTACSTRRAGSGLRRDFATPNNPAFCRKGSDHPSAKLFPLERTNRQITMYDPKTGKYTFVDTCFQTHHLQFGYDANDTLWTSGGGQVIGWVNTKMLDETGDIAQVAGLDRAGSGHQRQRQARRLRRA